MTLDLGIWLAFAVASLPTLEDLALHLRHEPWAAYALVFWGLLGSEVLYDRRQGPRRPIGMLVVAASLCLQYAMHAAGWPRFARPGVALGALGLALARGRPPLRGALLALWTVPVPTFLIRLTSPWLESGLLLGAGSVLAAAGAPLAVEGSRALGPAGFLEVQAPDGGLPLAALLSGLAWHRGLRRGDPPGATARRIAGWALLALPTQAFAVLVACALTAAGEPAAARLLLTHAPWAATSTVCLWRTARARARTRATNLER
jgi:hypothetical protein